jgi:hypothetical protein
MNKKQTKATSDQGRSFVPMVVVKRQDSLPGAFLFLNRHRTGLKTGDQLPSDSYSPIVLLKTNRVSEIKKILSLLSSDTPSENSKKKGKTKTWYHNLLSGGIN